MNTLELQKFSASFEPTTPKIKKLLEFLQQFYENYDEDPVEDFSEQDHERFAWAYETLVETPYLNKKPGTFTIGEWNLSCKEDFGGKGQGDDYWVVIEAAKEGEESVFFKVPG